MKKNSCNDWYVRLELLFIQHVCVINAYGMTCWWHTIRQKLFVKLCICAVFLACRRQNDRTSFSEIQADAQNFHICA